MGVSFTWNKPKQAVINDVIGGNKTHLFMASEARRLMQPYVPERQGSGMLLKNARVYVDNGQGIVQYLSPYARYQYHGKLMVSSLTGSAWSHGEYKILTAIDLKYSKPLATSYWDKAMKTARGKDLAKAVQKFIKGGAL